MTAFANRSRLCCQGQGWLSRRYPFPRRRLRALLDLYTNSREIVWCQEEPQNQGAWYQIRHRLQEPLSSADELFYAGRIGAAAPAAGYYQLHVSQQEALVRTALGGEEAGTEPELIRKKA